VGAAPGRDPTAQAKEFADLTHTKTMDVIAPFAALLKQDKAA
jgi:hypothetical protein